ncbi:MAG: hypothetical protein H6605_04900 [Flavobacteriales bacterium]|nr:hypothetical protein [Flavobacteriales bacterium]
MIKSIFTKTNVILFLISVLSVLWLLPQWVPSGNDREIFRGIGRSINCGKMPYLDYFDHKGPFIYLVFALTGFLKQWDVFVAGTLMLILCIHLISKMLEGQKGLLPFLIPVLFILWIRNPFYYEYGGLTREWTCYLYLIFLYIMVKNKPSWILWLISGVVFINQQNDLLPLLPLLFYQTFFRQKTSMKTLGVNLLIMMAPLILVSVWLLYHSAFNSFMEQAFLFNFKYYSRPSSMFDPDHIIKTGKTFIENQGPGIIGLLIFLFILLISQPPLFTTAILCSLALGVFNIGISGRYYGHYYLPVGSILVYIALIAGKVKIKSKLLNPAMILGILSIVFNIFLMNRNFSFTGNLEQAEYDRAVIHQIEEVITEHKPEIKNVAVFNYSPALPILAENCLPCSSQYLYFSVWDELPAWDKNLEEYKKILEQSSLDGTLIIDFTPNHSFVRNKMNSLLKRSLYGKKKLKTILNPKNEPMGELYLISDH